LGKAFKAKLPPYFLNERGAYKNAIGAHISLMNAHEVESNPSIVAFFADKCGKSVTFNCQKIQKTKPDHWRTIDKVWAMAVDSEELSTLRKESGLPPLLENHPFHFTFAVKNVVNKVLQTTTTTFPEAKESKSFLSTSLEMVSDHKYIRLEKEYIEKFTSGQIKISEGERPIVYLKISDDNLRDLFESFKVQETARKEELKKTFKAKLPPYFSNEPGAYNNAIGAHIPVVSAKEVESNPSVLNFFANKCEKAIVFTCRKIQKN